MKTQLNTTKSWILLAGILLSFAVRAEEYIFLHRSNSTTEGSEAASLNVGFQKVVDVYPGEWKLVIVNNDNRGVLINADFRSGKSYCDIPSYRLPTEADSVHFIFISEEYCSIRRQPASRVMRSFRIKEIQEAVRLANRRITQLSETDTKEVVRKLIDENISLNIGYLPLDLDSLRALALEALELRKKLAEQEEAMRQQLLEYFELMKAINQLDENVQPVVHVGMEEGGLKSNGQMMYNIRATFSYDIVSEGVQAELIHYPSGAYQLDKSAAAKATAFSMKKSIQNYLYEYFEPGSIAKVRIIGSADASPILAPITYEGEYKGLIDEQYEVVTDYQIITAETPQIDSVLIENMTGRDLQASVAAQPEALVHGQTRSVSISPAQGFTSNEELAYLRSFGIRQYIEENIEAIKKTRNEFLHQVKLEQGIGGIYRKVVMELLLEDVVRNK